MGGDNEGIHSMLVGARGREWCDAGMCMWCQRPEADPLRALCPGIEEDKREEQRRTELQRRTEAAGTSAEAVTVVKPLVAVTCSSIHTKFSQVEMEVGVQAWNDRVFAYDTVPAELLPGTLIRGPHCIKGGVVMTLKSVAEKPITLHVFHNNDGRNGGWDEGLPPSRNGGWEIFSEG